MTVPTTRKIYLNASSAAADNIRGDAAKLLSRHNHRLYRQGRLYNIRLGVDMDVNGVYEVYALRPDWMVMKGWQKAFEAFMNNSKEEMRSIGKLKGRWQDFRTGQLSLIGSQGDWEGTMRGVAQATTTLLSITSGEFDASEVHTEAGTKLTFSWTEPGSASILNILKEYDKMGNTNLAPTDSVPSLAYAGLDDDNQGNQGDHLIRSGDEPPYDRTGIEADTPLIKIATIGQVAPGIAQLSTGFFDAPCGLFIVRRVSGEAYNTTQANFYLEAKSGSYKGVAAESMGTAKLVKNHYEVK